MSSVKHQKIIKTHLEKLLKLLNVSPEKIDISISKEDDVSQVDIDLQIPEESSGILIGFHGETLNALQFLLSLITSQQLDYWYRFNLNINQYRSRRQEQLEQMAQNAAKRAILSGDEIELPYLTPAERRLIHLSLENRAKEVETFSEGEARQRRLIVRPIKK